MTNMLSHQWIKWTIGGLGVLLLLAVAVLLYGQNGSSGPGVAAGQRLRPFVAPLATGSLRGAANVTPACDPRHPARQGLSVCDREPTVLAFFATESKACIRSVSALQRVAGRIHAVQFAAVAIGAHRDATLALVRRHRWRIPVAYDMTGAVGQLYDVERCPLIEVARRGGIVAARLIGASWEQPSRLAAEIQGLLGSAQT